MCGITGIIQNQPIQTSVLEKINRALSHRGPDAEGYYYDHHVGLGQRRLSIIDLEGGIQPFSSDDGRFTLIFNGEIYNFLEIKQELQAQGIQFKTHSDTEVLLQIYIQKKEACLEYLNGMFAFAIWDKQEQKLFAARDRMGQKPFYYWSHPKGLVFGSELKIFKHHPDFSPRLNQQALSCFFQYEYIPTPLSIYEDVYKLPAGCYLTYQHQKLEIKSYWDIPLKDQKLEISESEAQSQLLELLDQAVTRRLISDVPLGVFLSGGLDSSSIVALMAKHREGKDIKTFSIGFSEKSYDETNHAQSIAKKFGTDHEQQILSPQKMIEILPEVVSFLDEPFADYSIIPTYLLSKFTRKKVTVALGGDGSDELFAGYPTFLAHRFSSIYQAAPRFLRKLAQALGNRLPVSLKDISFDFKVKQFLYGASFPPIHRNQVWLGSFHHQEQQQLFTSDFQPASNPLHLIDDIMKNCPSTQEGDRMLYFYEKFYLGDDILVKTDRASMATSLEVRAPYLDYKLVEFISSLPYAWKLKGKTTKYLLKKTLESLLPHDIIYRPKKGFGIPIAVWFRNELKTTMMETLDKKKLSQDGIFNPQFVQNLVQDHLCGKKNHRKQIFSLLMFQWWKEKYL